jgi:glycosyltransferase involved in cell wall biosynthesis
LAEGEYDAIHDHQDYIAGLHFLMGVGHLPPIRVAHIHNPLYHRTNYANGIVRRIIKASGKHMLSRLDTHIMGTSRQIVEEYGFHDSAALNVTLGVAHCGIDVTEYRGDYNQAHGQLCRELGWDKSAKIILFVGRLDGENIRHLGRTMTHKNPAFALEVARESVARDPRIRFLMVGSGDKKKGEFEVTVTSWGLERQIRIVGVRSDVPKLMQGSDLLLFPSVSEGLGMVVVEAQAAGLRVLASDTTPVECLVVPGVVKFLSLSDSSADWAEEALRLVNFYRPDAFG